MLGEDASTVGVDLDLPPDFPPGPFEPKVQSSNAAEQTAEREAHRPGPGVRHSKAIC